LVAVLDVCLGHAAHLIRVRARVRVRARARVRVRVRVRVRARARARARVGVGVGCVLGMLITLALGSTLVAHSVRRSTWSRPSIVPC